VLKAELHTHTADDPVDNIPYSTRDLIDRAAGLGFQVLAVTLHDRQLDTQPLQSYATARGITLVPGIERTIEGRHVLLLNFSRAGTMAVRSFGDLAGLRARESGIVIAPHPFFPIGESLREMTDRHEGLFDAVEYHGMFTSFLNFNQKAERWANAHGKPMVGNGDVHRLVQLGPTYSLIDAPPQVDAICAAIKAGRVQVHARPLSAASAVSVAAQLSFTLASQRLRGSLRVPVTRSE